MARRLSVVIAQHALRGQAQTAIEEAFVGQLIFIQGLDPSLVASLDRIEHGSTDHLFFEGLSSDFVLLSWTEPHSVARELVRIGVSGQLSAPGSAERLPFGQPSQRRVYHVHLDTSRTVNSVMHSLQDLLKVLNTPTVSIAMATKPKSVPTSSPGISVPVVSMPRKVEPKSTATTPLATNPAPPVSYVLDDEEEWEHLDQLVDELDESDI